MIPETEWSDSKHDIYLYIHIPFCRYRCDYCDFFSRTAVPEYRQREILRAVENQARCLVPRFAETLRTLYVGGGTPSSLAPSARDSLFLVLRYLVDSLGPVEETTLELNPEDITIDLLHHLADAGVNRLSVGVQSLQESALRRIGRHTSSEATRTGLQILNQEWSRHGRRWSADLITGIPGRTRSDVLRDLEAVLSYQPGHLSVYELSVEPNTVLGHARRRNSAHGNAPDNRYHLDQEADQFRSVADALQTRGFYRYEVSNFARPHEESRHNQAYWHMKPHLGIGPGAVGTLPEPRPIRFTNTRDFKRYLSAKNHGLHAEPLSHRTLLEEILMMGLRTTRGVSLHRMERLAGKPLYDLLPESLSRWNLPVPDSEETPYWVLPERHRDLLNRFLTDVFVELDHSMRAPVRQESGPDGSASAP